MADRYPRRLLPSSPEPAGVQLPYGPHPQPEGPPEIVHDPIGDIIRGVTVGSSGPADSNWAKGAELFSALPLGGGALRNALSEERYLQLLRRMGGTKTAKPPGIRAYHGSPHDFDKFDIKKVGTGEGAQAYGHGIYFAQEPKVAEDYRRRLSGQGGIIPGASAGRGKYMVSDVPVPEGIAGHAALDTAQDLQGLLYYKKHGYADMATVVQPQIERRIAKFRAEDAQGYHQGIAGEDMRALADYYDQHVKLVTPDRIGERPPGRMYEVQLNVDPQHLLDWDVPMVGQSPHVQERLASIGLDSNATRWGWQPHQATEADIATQTFGPSVKPGDWVAVQRNASGGIEYHAGRAFGSRREAAANAAQRQQMAAEFLPARGQELYTDLAAELGKPGAFPEIRVKDKVAASERLREAGVRGIKYLDQGSRTAGEGSRNYVMFDDSLIDILRKYGLLAPLAASAAARTLRPSASHSQVGTPPPVAPVASH